MIYLPGPDYHWLIGASYFKGDPMKTNTILVILFGGILYLAGCNSNQTDPFEGNWDLVSRTVKLGEQVVGSMVKDRDNFGMKMIHDGYWMFTGQETNDDGTYQYYGYSTYTFKGNILTEHIIYQSVPDNIGELFPWETTVEGDKLILKGPVNIDSPLEVTETYMRK